MNKPQKVFLLAILAVIVLMMGTLALIVATFDANDYKERITAEVADLTGRKLSIPGDISLSVFPWIGLETGKVILENARGFGDEPFVEFDSAEIKVKLIPLLSKRIEVKALNVSGLNLNLARNKEGVTNWDDLIQAPAEEQPGEPTEQTIKEGGDKQGMEGVTIGGVNVTGANLVWDDRMGDVNYSIKDLNVSTGPLVPGKPAEITLTTAVASSKPAAKGTVAISTTVHLGDEMEKGSLSNLKLTLDLTGEDLPGGKLRAVVSGDAELDMAGKTATVTNLKAEAYGVSLSGKAKVLHYDSDPLAEVDLSLAEFNPKKVMESLGLEPLKTSDPAALTAISGRIEGAFSSKSGEVRKLDLNVDGEAVTGTLTARDYAKPDLVFDLSAGSLNIDRYLPPKSETPEPVAAEEKPAREAEKKKDEGFLSDEQREQLRAMVLDGKLRVAALKAWKMSVSDVVLNIKAANGVFDIDPLDMSLYGGAYKSSVKADFSGERMSSALNLNLADMRLGSLLKDVAGSEAVTGLARLNLKVTSVGEALWPILRSLNGRGSAGLADGSFKGVQVVPEKVRDQVNAQGKTEKLEQVEKEQKFKSLDSDFIIDRGVLRTSALKLVGDGLGATGTGSVDLAEQTIDYKAQVDMTALPLIPFDISGPITNPSYSLDTGQFLANTAKGIVTLPLKAGEGAVESIGGGIKSLFGGGKKDEERKQ